MLFGIAGVTNRTLVRVQYLPIYCSQRLMWEVNVNFDLTSAYLSIMPYHKCKFWINSIMVCPISADNNILIVYIKLEL